MALKFDVDGYASVAGWTVPSVGTTICFWMSVFSIPALQRFFGCGDTFEARTFSSPLKYRQDLYDNAGGLMSTALPLTTRDHYLMTGTRAGTVKTYLNGVLDNTNTSSSDAPASPATFMFGGNSSDTSFSTMEDFRVYNRELTVQEINAIYFSNGHDNIINGLINRWLVTNKATELDIGADTIYDIATKQDASKGDDFVYYTGGKITPRRRV